ncbi:ATP-binding protein [Sungkyunkwania multivorans]|uniref:histidine kinase n=1 Tax=Sungkyunkwania multivorans TaxID=1173618 RepID=A0ABW3CZY7_9FLAO
MTASKEIRSLQFLPLFAILLVSGIVLAFFVDNHIKEIKLKERALLLKQVNTRAAEELTEALDKFTVFVSGIRTYTNHTGTFPTKDQLFSFVKEHYRSSPGQSPMVISYLDTTHVFRYSFTHKKDNPDGLVGTHVKDIVGTEGVGRLATLMLNEEFKCFGPVNLIEGRVGIPIGFGVIDEEGKSLGYITAITDFKPIINKIYTTNATDDFVFRFRTNSGVDFDRERVYDHPPSFNDQKDPEYYKNFTVAEDSFIYSKADFHGFEVVVGTAYKKPYIRDEYTLYLFLAWLITLGLFLVFVLKEIWRIKRINKQIGGQKDELSKLIATKDKFFSIIAHDLRSPLATIINYIDLIQDPEIQEEDSAEILGELKKSTQSSLSLLDNLLKWSRLQTGELKFSPKSIYLTEPAIAAIEVLSPLIQQKSIDLHLNIDSKLQVFADKNMVETIIRNLVSNAIKFSHQKGDITIRAIDKKNHIKVTVSDTGVGIPESKIPLLFNITTNYTQLGTDREVGTGLGLVICKEFVEKHGGEIRAESNEGQGSSFIFTLPKKKF